MKCAKKKKYECVYGFMKGKRKPRIIRNLKMENINRICLPFKNTSFFAKCLTTFSPNCSKEPALLSGEYFTTLIYVSFCPWNLLNIIHFSTLFSFYTYSYFSNYLWLLSFSRLLEGKN